ncbi:hypothetical protein [Pedobacter cryoconitis]|uniref:Glycosyltransferase involved in cell wall biosynthesis n=1 Tax=Pedobacter cryoconitis TaxID=188932 RepID=A0A7X0J4Z7_9SPHI|nr:hypothetical protein [Pedobacter cryoconitis]MBB6500970.1 hypothetical protein [Pedobacter cryoconitis]
MINLTKESTIYILAPGTISSGGPEALHQLAYYLNKCGYSAFICYYGSPMIPPRYLIYEPKVISIDLIEDRKGHVIIAPEIATRFLKKYKNLTKCIWWLSLQFYDGYETIPVGFKMKFHRTIRDLIPLRIMRWKQAFLNQFFLKRAALQPYLIQKNDINLCGSMFAYNFVKRRHKNVVMFVEPIGLPFLKQDFPEFISNNRSRVVLYNPAKPSSLMNKLLKQVDIQFVPIKGMDVDQMINLFRKSKLYIDFGFFGGPERLPKETVHNGCMLLVGKRNAAVNSFDVAIPEEFKIEDFNDEVLILKKIKYMLDHYDEIIDEFKAFRVKIENLEANFIHSIQNIFIKGS